MIRKALVMFLFARAALGIYDLPQLLNPSLASANTMINGGLETQGHWGGLPPHPSNVFSTTWDNAGYKQMYNINSIGPFAGDRGTGFDAILRQASPAGLTSTDFYPLSASFLSDGSPNPYSYDLNSPMYRDLYKRYYNFYNTNLNLMKSKISLKPDSKDLNRDYWRKKVNPDSFKYNTYFDLMPKSASLRSTQLPEVTFDRSATSSPARALRLARKQRLAAIKHSAKPADLLKLKRHIDQVRNRILKLERAELSATGPKVHKKRAPQNTRAKQYSAAMKALSFDQDPLAQFGLI